MSIAMGRLSSRNALEELLPLLARHWRSARDQHDGTQRRLHRLLAPRGAGILAPVFDSLMALCEAALERRFSVGTSAALSSDERLLVDLLDGSRRSRACVTCAEEARTMLDCSLCSTRIMLALVGDVSPAVDEAPR